MLENFKTYWVSSQSTPREERRQSSIFDSPNARDWTEDCQSVLSRCSWSLFSKGKCVPEGNFIPKGRLNIDADGQTLTKLNRHTNVARAPGFRPSGIKAPRPVDRPGFHPWGRAQ